jgi:predicted nucleic acid-binding protein
VRLVVDTNLMIRALLSAGPARQFFKVVLLQHQLVYHAEQLAELREVAARPRLRIAPEAVAELVDRIERYGRRVDSASGSDGSALDFGPGLVRSALAMRTSA